MGGFMNNLNYATLEASKKLHDAGIMLETEKYWAWDNDKRYISHIPRLMNKGGANSHNNMIPAPSMAEVWRELPFQSYIKKLDDGSTLVWICDDDADGKYIESNMIANTNPTDALIDLLVWLKGAGK
jgi:hypothetical protein